MSSTLPLLHNAVYEKDTEKIKKLIIDENHDVDTLDDKEVTPLLFSIYLLSLEPMNTLIDHDANVNILSFDGWHILHLLALNDNTDDALEMAKSLLEKSKTRININARLSDLSTPLHIAASKGNKEMCELLLSHKALIDAQDINDMTPLHVAVSNGNVEIIELLLSSGANTEMISKFGTPHRLADTLSGYDHIVEILEKHSAT